MSQQHTQEPVAEVCATSYIANDGDVHTKIEIKRLQNVKVGTLLYAFPPDASARIAELERTLRQQAEAVTATINRHHQQMAELEKQRDTLLAAAQQAANEIRKCDYTPARSTLLTAIASVKEQA